MIRWEVDRHENYKQTKCRFERIYLLRPIKCIASDARLMQEHQGLMVKRANSNLESVCGGPHTDSHFITFMQTCCMVKLHTK